MGVVMGDKDQDHANQRSGGAYGGQESSEEVCLLNEIGKQKRLVEMSSGNDRVAPQKEKGYPLLTFQSGCKCFAIFSHLFLDLLPFFISVIPPLLLLSYLLESFSQSPPLASFPTLTSKCGVSWTPL